MSCMLNSRMKQSARECLRIIMRADFLKKALRFLSMKNLLPEFIWRRLPVEGVFEVKVPGGARFNYCSTRHDAIGRSLFWKGIFCHEGETVAEFIRHIKDAKVFFDIGANTGIYSLISMAVNPSVNVVAFEPVDRIRRHLKNNIEINGFTKRCIILGMKL